MCFFTIPNKILSFPLAHQPCKQLKEIVEYVSRAFHNSQQQQQQIVMCFVFGGLNAKLVSLQNPTPYNEHTHSSLDCSMNQLTC